ncbi:hypothetical protein PR048_004682 [Dryococelus australis]|uniref:Uncharacterized protein n=1 Tax=Dryococelus australis TaxID=614101 RepID=A0ABQ9I6G6_9NEOP|nr:hypothetical protein PR048_004682 [Dryococelus australis]
MYHQVAVHDTDTSFQLIVWRPSPEEPIQDYKLLTVTYGESYVPYLAIRNLRQLAIDEQESLFLSSVVLRNFYVDDLFAQITDTVSSSWRHTVVQLKFDESSVKALGVE